MKKHKIVLALMMMLIGLGFSSFVFDSSSASAASYTASISTSGNINLDVSSAGNGANITTDNISIVSTCPSGYNVSIAAKSATNTTFSDTTLYKDGDKTNTADTKKINTSTGTIASPVSILGNNNKTWGYTTQAINNGSAVTINSNFVGLTNTQTLLTTSASGTSATGTTLPVYYGVSVDNTIEPGLYKMSDDAVITYYLTTSLDCTSYQVAFNPTSTAGGQTLSGTGTMDNQRISEGVATALTTNAFTAPTVSGKTYYFAGWNTAQDGTGTTYTNGQSVTDLTTVGNTITLYAQWTDCPANNVCYDPNGVSTPTTMGNQSIDAGATSIDLWASNFQNEEYGFAGWSTEPIAVTDDILRKSDIPATVAVYGPNETITDANIISNISTAGLKLYAVWAQYNTPDYMQEWATLDRCSELGVGDVIGLMDARDEQTYAVAKLADGNCWMIENLRLDNQYTTSSADIAKAQGYNSSFIGLANPETANFSSSTTANSLYSIDGSTSAPAITGNSQGYRFPRYNNQNTSSPATNMTAWGNSANTYSVGNWYTWSAAVADTSYYNTENQTVSSTSICPSGWHLPSGGDKNNFTSSEFWKLSRAAIGADPANYESSTTPYYTGTPEGSNASNILRSYPNNFIYSGYFSGSSPRNRGSYGFYWSSTVCSNSTSYPLYFGSSYVSPGTSSRNKYYGFSVRCVAGS